MSRFAVVPRTTTCFTPESSKACPRTGRLAAFDLTPTPLVTEGRVMTIFGAVVSLIGGLIVSVVVGGWAVFLLAVVLPELSGRLAPEDPEGVPIATFSPL